MTHVPIPTPKPPQCPAVFRWTLPNGKTESLPCIERAMHTTHRTYVLDDAGDPQEVTWEDDRWLEGRGR